MLESFGARLRRQREEQDIALGAIAEQTKIKVSLLDALERDDVSHWPSGIFRRAFIRAYAQSIGLNPDLVVAEFLELYPDPIQVVAMAAPIESSADGARASGGPPTRLRYIVGSAIDSLSKLRRSSSVEDPVAAERVTVSVPAASRPDLPTDGHAPTGPSPIESMNEAVADCTPVDDPATSEPDLLAAANLCTEFGRVENTTQLQPLLQEAARILDAIGLIVWVWDGIAEDLRPTLAHGYSDRVLAQLPTVRADADNATAAAFRSAQACTINGSDHDRGALVVPLLTPAGCAGVLAMELQHGSEQTRSVRAVATIFAAQLAQLIGGAQPAAIRPQAEEGSAPLAQDWFRSSPIIEPDLGRNRSATVRRPATRRSP